MQSRSSSAGIGLRSTSSDASGGRNRMSVLIPLRTEARPKTLSLGRRTSRPATSRNRAALLAGLRGGGSVADGPGRRLLFRRRRDNAVLAGPLRFVERLVGGRDEAFDGLVRGEACCPETRGHPDELAVRARDAEIVHELPDPLRGVARAREVRAWKHDGDLLATVPAREVELADGLGKDARDGAYHLTAGLADTGSSARTDVPATPSFAALASKATEPSSIRWLPVSARAPTGPPAITRPCWTRTSAACFGIGVADARTASSERSIWTATVTRATTRPPLAIVAVAAIRGSAGSVPTAWPCRTISALWERAMERNRAVFRSRTAC